MKKHDGWQEDADPCLGDKKVYLSNSCRISTGGVASLETLGLFYLVALLAVLLG
jgi:hypothetical protein